jgi:hypothetical protein
MILHGILCLQLPFLFFTLVLIRNTTPRYYTNSARGYDTNTHPYHPTIPYYCIPCLALLSLRPYDLASPCHRSYHTVFPTPFLLLLLLSHILLALILLLRILFVIVVANWDVIVARLVGHVGVLFAGALTHGERGGLWS